MELDAKARSPASRLLIVNRGTRRMGTSHDQLEQLLRDFNAAYNARRQPVLEVVMNLCAGNDQVARHDCPQAVPVRCV